MSGWGMHDALAAVKNNKRSPLTKGDALIILDTAELSKVRLVPSSTLFSAVPRLSRSGAQPDPIAGDPLSSRLSYLMVLSGGTNSVPELVARPSTHELASTENGCAEGQRTRVQHQVKVEAGLAKRDAQMAETDWAKAYDSFLRLVCRQGSPLNKLDFDAALPQITSIVAVAANLDGSKVQTLRSTRIEIDIQLLGLSILAKLGDDTTPANIQHAVMWTTINLYRDWMAEHINYLRGSSNNGEGPCFYRVVAMDGDVYLQPGDVLKQWDTVGFSKKGEVIVTKSLNILKRKAADLVAPLLQSTLQLPDKDELEYLTCVQVWKEDIQWYVEAEGDLDDDGDEKMVN